ncbi:hypothetical protein ACWCPQ_14455 [Nocardia sp. NPDC001965]
MSVDLLHYLGFDRTEIEVIKAAADAEGESVDGFAFEAMIERASRITGEPL